MLRVLSILKPHCLCLQALTRAGYGVHFVPVLQFVFTNEQELFSALLADSVGYSGAGCTLWALLTCV